jgi:serine/threonine-protein kinase
MDSTRWERIQSLFHDVADLPEPEQRAFLKAACGDDEGLVADVLALVEEDARGTSLLDRDLAHVAHDVLDEAVPFREFRPYRIKEALGEGGMGVVYLAERTDLGSLVAMRGCRRLAANASPASSGHSRNSIIHPLHGSTTPTP